MNLGSLLITAVAAVLGAAIAKLLHLPAAQLIGALVGVAIVNMTSVTAFYFPSCTKWIVYVLIGWLLGVGVTNDTLSQLRSATGPSEHGARSSWSASSGVSWRTSGCGRCGAISVW